MIIDYLKLRYYCNNVSQYLPCLIFTIILHIQITMQLWLREECQNMKNVFISQEGVKCAWSYFMTHQFLI